MRVVGWIVVGLVIIAVIFGLGYVLRWWLAPAEGALEAREQTQAEGEFRIQAYDHFFDLCSSIQGMEGQIAALEAELADAATTPDRAEQLRASIAGIEGQRFQSIARYNADAQKDYTVGQFRDADLPYQLDPEEETVCVV